MLLPGIELTWTAGILFVVFYSLRVFGLTGGFHRYFAHRAYKTSRFFQFVLAFLGGSALQRGALWWAGHHRHHHRHSDTEEDVHSPIVDSFFYSHLGWIFDPKWSATPYEQIHDFAKYPELRFLEKFHWLPGILVAVICYAVGGWSGLVWGFFVGTVAVYHVTFVINSLCHVWGRRYYPTTDYSKNNLLLALLTFGEGWHNNHHHYQSSANQGFFWWEIDITYSILKLLSWCGVVWDLRVPPEAKRARSEVPVPPPYLVEPAVATKPAEESMLPPVAAQTMAAAQAVATALSGRMAAAAHAATEQVSAVAQAAHERMTHVTQSAAESVKAATQAFEGKVNAATAAAHERVTFVAQVASEAALAIEDKLAATAQAASESVKQAKQAVSDAVAAASPAAVAAASVAAPLVIVVTSVSQGS